MFGCCHDVVTAEPGRRLRACLVCCASLAKEHLGLSHSPRAERADRLVRKPHRTVFRERDYAAVRKLGDDHARCHPRRVAR